MFVNALFCFNEIQTFNFFRIVRRFHFVAMIMRLLSASCPVDNSRIQVETISEFVPSLAGCAVTTV